MKFIDYLCCLNPAKLTPLLFSTLSQIKHHIICFALLIASIVTGSVSQCYALSFNLDSIADWGKFPRFCVNTYRWGDKFFNGYDTLYVEPTGYKFNAKVKLESWTDYYQPKFKNDARMTMFSDPSTSLGFYLTYLAVSVGYDVNISKVFGIDANARKRWQFGFNCMLFSANLYLINNDVGTTIKRFQFSDGHTENLDLDFHGINTSEWGINLYYFFNHKRYSQAAAFNFSRVQQRSGGSFFAGLAFTKQNYQFDFSELPDHIREDLPLFDEDRYVLNSHNYAFMGGYGYNWAFRRGWNWGVTVAPMLGWTDGLMIGNSVNEGTTFAMLLQARTGVVWNHKQWFAASIFSCQANLIGSRERNMLTSYFTFEVSAGFRFNIW